MGQRNSQVFISCTDDHDRRSTDHMIKGRLITAIYESFNFPQEILEEIMSYLPPKSLIRFKCVSKSWYALINALMKNAEFVAKHLRYSTNSNNIFSPAAGLIFKNTNLSSRARKVLDQDDCDKEPIFFLLSLFNDYHHGHDKHHGLRFVAEHINLHELIIKAKKDMRNVTAHHCDGIIFLTYFDTYILYNPAIREFKLLPKAHEYDHKYLSFGKSLLGFGYDSRANDYKVVESKASNKFSRRIYVAKVYSLSTDSWKEIENPLEFKYSPIPHKEVYFKGVCYWLMEDLMRIVNKPNDIIVSFDMCNEEFCTISLPQSLQTPKVNCTSFAVWNESVALFFFPGEKRASVQSIEIWVLVNDCLDDGVGGTSSCILVKQMSIGPLVNVSCPLAFWKSDELLMKSTKKGELVSYNLRNKKLRKLRIHGVNRISSSVFFYVKSLVSVQAKQKTS